MPGTPVRIERVDSEGIGLRGFGDRPLDVTFDGRRVWSFWLVRDTRKAALGRRWMAWPPNLHHFLDGTTRLGIREHVSHRVLFDEERSFGTSPARIEVVNALGAPLGIDKSGRLTATFESRSTEHVEPLLNAIGQVIGALGEAGVEAFPGYGTLLGAVREQQLLGHDSDADLCYVSRLKHPVDVARESFGLQRALQDRGYHTRRYSGGAFKVDVVEADGVVRGLDVFGGYFDDGPVRKLYLMGEVGHPFEESWIFPLGTCTLAGRTFPAPAHPEHLLEAMYGPGWRVPDPAFKFETPYDVVRALDGWFRGTRPNRSFWDRRYSTVRHRLPGKVKGSRLARLAAKDLPPDGQVLDLGCGRGADALWLARQGAIVTGYDYATAGAQAAGEAASVEGLSLEIRDLNFNEWRSVFAEGARIAHRPGPRMVLAHHVADAITPFARDSLVRFSSMALRDGGRLFLDVWTGEGEAPAPHLRPVSLEVMRALLERHGARIVEAQQIPVAPEGGWPKGGVGRLVAQWTA